MTLDRAREIIADALHEQWWPKHEIAGKTKTMCEHDADAILAALHAAGMKVEREPKTIQELQEAIGSLKWRLHRLVAGDPTECVSVAALPATQGGER